MRLQGLAARQQDPRLRQGQRMGLRHLRGGDDLAGLQQRLHLDLRNGEPSAMLAAGLGGAAGEAQQGQCVIGCGAGQQHLRTQGVGTQAGITFEGSRQSAAFLRMCGGGLQVTPFIADARQPQMHLTGHAVGLIAEQLQGTLVSAGGQVQVVVVLLQMPECHRGADRDHAIAARLRHCHHVAISLLGRRSVAAEMKGDRRGTVGRSTHRQLIRRQRRKRQSGLSRHRPGIAARHRFPCGNSVQLSPPARVGGMLRCPLDRCLGTDHRRPHQAVLAGRQI